MNRERFYVEPNGAGGWDCSDRRAAWGAPSVTSSAFREFAEKAATRLNNARKGDRDNWPEFYRVTL